MVHATATRVDGHGVITLNANDVPTALFWIVRSLKERQWAGASVVIRNEEREVVFEAVVPATLPKDA